MAYNSRSATIRKGDILDGPYKILVHEGGTIFTIVKEETPGFLRAVADISGDDAIVNVRMIANALNREAAAAKEDVE